MYTATQHDVCNLNCSHSVLVGTWCFESGGVHPAQCLVKGLAPAPDAGSVALVQSDAATERVKPFMYTGLTGLGLVVLTGMTA